MGGAAGQTVEVEVGKKLLLEELKGAIKGAVGVSAEGMKVWVGGEGVEGGEEGWKQGEVVHVVEAECLWGQRHLHNMTRRGPHGRLLGMLCVHEARVDAVILLLIVFFLMQKACSVVGSWVRGMEKDDAGELNKDGRKRERGLRAAFV